MSIQNELFDAVYYGCDLEFRYQGNYYFINSGVTIQDTVEVHGISVYRSKESFYEGDGHSPCEEIYSSCQKDANENTHTLFEVKIFDGNALSEIIPEISDISY